MNGTATVTVYLTLREIEMMKKLDHPNIVKIFEVFRSPDDLHVVMELCGGGELQDKLDNLPATPCPPPFPDMVPRFKVEEACTIMKEILSAINYLHINGIVHRDIKLENFVYSGPSKGEGIIKLIDFGFARSNLETQEMTMNCGSLVYKAPEVMRSVQYSEASDIWSLGLICHMLVTGMIPWQGDAAKEIEQSILKEVDDPKKFDEFLTWFYTTLGLEAACTDFIMKLLRVDPDERMTASSAFDHPWMTGKALEGQGPTPPSSPRAVDSKISYQLVNKLTTFTKQNAMQRTAMLALAFTASKEELDTLAAQFKEMDTANSGTISFEEFSKVMTDQNKTGQDLDTEELRVSFQAIDQDGSGEIKYSEFVAAAMAQKQYTDDQLRAAFKRLNISGTGEISPADLELLGWDTEHIDELLETVSDDSKTFGFNEFKRQVSARRKRSSMLSGVPQGLTESSIDEGEETAQSKGEAELNTQIAAQPVVETKSDNQVPSPPPRPSQDQVCIADS